MTGLQIVKFLQRTASECAMSMTLLQKAHAEPGGYSSARCIRLC
jgi:hypothetical protein